MKIEFSEDELTLIVHSLDRYLAYNFQLLDAALTEDEGEVRNGSIVENIVDDTLDLCEQIIKLIETISSEKDMACDPEHFEEYIKRNKEILDAFNIVIASIQRGGIYCTTILS